MVSKAALRPPALWESSEARGGGPSFLAPVMGDAAETARAGFKAALGLQLARKRAPQAVGLYGVAHAAFGESGVLRNLAAAGPVAAAWGDLEMALS